MHKKYQIRDYSLIDERLYDSRTECERSKDRFFRSFIVLNESRSADKHFGILLSFERKIDLYEFLTMLKKFFQYAGSGAKYGVDAFYVCNIAL